VVRRLSAAGVAIAVALIPQAVFAHAVLLQSDPAPDSRLETAPANITLIFSEPVTPAGAGIKVYSPGGLQVAGPAVSSGSVLSATINSSQAGTYVVSWQISAADTHPSRGAFSFIVGRPSANPYSALTSTPAAGTATPLGLAFQAIAQWVHFAGFALLFGVAGYCVMTGRQEGFGRLTATGVVLLITAAPLALLGQLASLSFDGDTAVAVLGSGFGRILGLRLGAALLAWTLLPARRPWILVAIGGVVALLDGASAHAIPGLPGVGQLIVAVHVMAMGLWVGGLAAFLLAPDKRFRRYAVWMLVVAVATGALLAFAHTRFGVVLITSDYGRVLLVKIVAVGAVLVLAIARRRRIELAALAVTIAVAAVLAALPPPI
jgi:copper transport protein